MTQVLVVDDEAPMREALEATFRGAGWDVRAAAGVKEALAFFRMAPCPLVVTDMRLPDGNGLRVMQGVRAMAPRTAVIFLTAFGNVPEAVQAMREGACDYLVKPVGLEQLRKTAERILAPRGAPVAETPNAPPPEAVECGFIGRSPSVRLLLERAQQVARNDADILIQAESGAGKEVLARFIHRAGRRGAQPFIAVNCAAFPETLLESELFGHVRGAFTGATANRPGRFEQAHGGTLLLDEIAEMPLTLQPKLLRVLQEREVDRLGDTRPVSVDVRIIATTNRSLARLVAEGRFRADLYYRLNVVPLTIPPLRERRGDIPALVEHFLAKYDTPGAPPVTLPEDFLARLQSYHWPGNVRELENLVRRALALSSAAQAAEELLAPEEHEPEPPFTFHGAQAGGAAVGAGAPRMRPGITWEQAEKELLEATLAATHGNRTRAAEILGLSLRTVRNKIRQYGLPPRWPAEEGALSAAGSLARHMPAEVGR